MSVNWDPSKHPRHPPGSSQGGEFAPAVGDFVKLTKPGLNGPVGISGRVTRILADGRAEVRTQQDGYFVLGASALALVNRGAPSAGLLLANKATSSVPVKLQQRAAATTRTAKSFTDIGLKFNVAPGQSARNLKRRQEAFRKAAKVGKP